MIYIYIYTCLILIVRWHTEVISKGEEANNFLVWTPFGCVLFCGYRQTSNISRTLVDDRFVDLSDVVGASPVGAAPTT